MPTYEYICKNCNYEFEEFQKITDPVLTDCPKCKKPRLQRKISGGAGLLFKGSGFYITDYKNDNGSKTNISKQKEPPKSDNKKNPKKTEKS